jgi:hypothetical protein
MRVPFHPIPDRVFGAKTNLEMKWSFFVFFAVTALSRLDTWDLCYKTLQIRNLQKNDRFRSKLASSGLDKHASLLRSP